jgi:uncharacterized protein with GYD domain
MPNYVILVNWTDQGTKNVKDSVRPAEGFETTIEKAGGKSWPVLHTWKALHGSGSTCSK